MSHNASLAVETAIAGILIDHVTQVKHFQRPTGLGLPKVEALDLIDWWFFITIYTVHSALGLRPYEGISLFK